MVRFENVGLRYGMGPEILSDVSFELERGSFHFLTGPSGAGKTTLLRLLFLSLKPSRGRAQIFGHDIAALKRNRLPGLRQRIGVVFQDFRLLDHLTTFENVALPLKVQKKRPAKYADDVMELLDWVGLGERADAFPPVLSGGEKQRAAIARAVISKPEMLLADEPTGNVDAAIAKRLLKLFVELNRVGTTVVLATHDTNLMGEFDAPNLCLEDGHLSVRQLVRI
ncbi:MAG: cell division ATP-binding protein FtsE [Hyphomicrobiales bacterium]